MGSLPERVLAGQAAELTYTIRNFGRLPAYNLRLRYRALPEALEQTAETPVIRRLGPGQTEKVTVAIRPIVPNTTAFSGAKSGFGPPSGKATRFGVAGWNSATSTPL